MKKLLTLLFMTISLLLISDIGYAQELKIGIVDMNAVLQKSTLMTSLNNDLTKQFQSRQNELIDAQKKLQDEKNTLNLNAGNMSNDDRNKLQLKIVSDQANVDILTASFQKDLTIAKDAALKKFMAKFNDAINQIAQSEHYDIIEQGNNMLYINSNLNITDKIISAVK